jgi:isoquinoline 1-oxidoreductase beta subunit
VTIVSSQFDMGQGSYHGIATLVLEELGARWDQVEVIGGANDLAAFGNLAWGGFAQGTGGSTSMASSWDRYRLAGAAAREMMIAAAAESWGVPPGRSRRPRARSRTDRRPRDLRRAGRARRRHAGPRRPRAQGRGRLALIGDEALRRYDSAPKTNGTAPFTIDVALPGMLTATMIHPPKFGATVRSFDAAAAKAIPGVVDVVETPRGLAVIGEHMWAAIQGRDAVTVEWDDTAAETRGHRGDHGPLP